MNSDESATGFSSLFEAIYHRFYKRVRPGVFQPGREALAMLRHLSLSGPLTVTEAAAHFSRSQASTSELISRLEARELIARVPDQRDGRRQLVWLTEAGTEALEANSHVLSQTRLARAFHQLPEAERTEILTALERILATTPLTEGWDDD